MMGVSQQLNNLLSSQRSSLIKMKSGATYLAKFNVYNFVKACKDWYPTTTKASSTQVISKPSLVYYYYGKNRQTSSSCMIKLVFQCKLYKC